MKKVYSFLLALLFTLTSWAQTLNVRKGNVVYQFPSAQTGDMNFANGSTLTIMGKTFSLPEITNMTVDESAVTNNLVDVKYNGTSATVYIAGNVAKYIDATVSGAHVTINQTNTDLVDGAEISYSLSGSSSNGSLSLGGEYKCEIQLAGVSLTNPNGAAINITNKKRIEISAKRDTENTLADCANGSQKGCIYSKGQLQIQGNGKLTVSGNTAHAIKSGDYITIKNLTLVIPKAVSDGISCNKYFQMISGDVSISGVGDDGIQADLEADATTTGETTNHDGENSGNVYLEGGNLTITVTSAAAKGVKAAGNLIVTDGTINITTSGNGTYDSTAMDAKGCSALKCDGDMTISGGNLILKSTGSGGKCIKADGKFTCTGGTIEATTTGATYSYSTSRAQPKAIKSDGDMNISGGNITAKSNSHEAIETKSVLTITDGTVYAFSAADDAINSASNMYLKGGAVTGVSNKNDGIDSNGNMYISGGTIIACGGGTPECGLDAAERYYLYITGGTVLAIGGGNNTVTSTTGSQCVLSTSGANTAGTAVSISDGSNSLASFTIPADYSPSSSGMGGGGWRPGGSTSTSGFSYLLSCDGLTSGTSYTVTIGSSSSSCRAATSYSGR